MEWHHVGMADQPPDKQPDSEAEAHWRGILNGDGEIDRRLGWQRRTFRHLPSSPRCKLCMAPYGAPLGPVMKLVGYGPWDKNPTMCNACMRQMEKSHGGAEVELSVLFADIRGSTELAAKIPTGDYRRLVNAFYALASHAVTDVGGSIDKYLGDGVLALFIPGFAGRDHAATAISSARRILEDAATSPRIPEAARPLPLGIGLNTGTAYVGIVGEASQKLDFTALGDAVNLAERLSSVAMAGELIIGEATATAAGLDTSALQARQLELKGIDHPVAAWSEMTRVGSRV